VLKFKNKLGTLRVKNKNVSKKLKLGLKNTIIDKTTYAT
jgi:hypothetical protein